MALNQWEYIMENLLIEPEVVKFSEWVTRKVRFSNRPHIITDYQITSLLKINSNVLTNKGYVPVRKWLIREKIRIQARSKCRVRLRRSGTDLYLTVDKVKIGIDGYLKLDWSDENESDPE
jgi:hypothetical protein